MKKLLIAIGLAFAATSASANVVSGALECVGCNSLVTVNHNAGDGSDQLWGGDGSTLDAGLYTAGYAGSVKALQDGLFVATFLGKVAGFDNMYVGGQTIGNSVGATAAIAVTAGQNVSFSFKDGGDGSTFANGQGNTAFQGFLVFNAAAWNAAHNTAYDFLIGYNDTATVNADYDDYVVGVINAVPVPAALPLMASALGAFGVARRKSKAKSA
jgi:hypothetical protein